MLGAGERGLFVLLIRDTAVVTVVAGVAAAILGPAGSLKGSVPGPSNLGGGRQVLLSDHRHGWQCRYQRHRQHNADDQDPLQPLSFLGIVLAARFASLRKVAERWPSLETCRFVTVFPMRTSQPVRVRIWKGSEGWRASHRSDELFLHRPGGYFAGVLRRLLTVSVLRPSELQTTKGRDPVG